MVSVTAEAVSLQECLFLFCMKIICYSVFEHFIETDLSEGRMWFFHERPLPGKWIKK